MASEIERISVEEARRKTEDGEAQLVCAYDDEAKCSRMMLDGALSLAALNARLPQLRKDQEIIFYCG
jgi:hypothetical protein